MNVLAIPDIHLKHGISLEQALQRFMVWCVEEPEKFTFWHKNAMAKSDDYDK